MPKISYEIESMIRRPILVQSLQSSPPTLTTNVQLENALQTFIQFKFNNQIGFKIQTSIWNE
jgi:hypothetical protein